MNDVIDLLEDLIEMTDEEYQNFKKHFEENKGSVSEDMQKFTEALFATAESFRCKADMAAEQTPTIVEFQGVRVLTTAQLAEAYGTDTKIITKNYNRNSKRYILGKHYICLEGDDLKTLKAKRQIDVPPNVHTFYLWTEKGALLHAKSLNTDKAWEVYDYLVDFYFRIKENATENNIIATQNTSFVTVSNPIATFQMLLSFAKEQGINVTSRQLKSRNSTLRGNNIGINTNLTMEQACFELAYELSQKYIYCDVGDVLSRTIKREYDKRVVRTAQLLLKVAENKIA